jgi:hypothetical protein
LTRVFRILKFSLRVTADITFSIISQDRVSIQDPA